MSVGIRLVEDNDVDESFVRTSDMGPVIRLALELADKGVFDFRLTLPNGKKLSVERFIERFKLKHLVQYQPEGIS